MKWENSCAKTIKIKSLVGNKCKVKYANITQSEFSFDASAIDGDTVEFATEKGKTYIFANIPLHEIPALPKNLNITADLELSWEYDGEVNIWRALDGEGCYTLVAENVSENNYKDSLTFDAAEIFTYKITPASVKHSSGVGIYGTLNHSSALQRQQYIYKVKQTNLASPRQPERLELGFYEGKGEVTLNFREV